MEFRGRNSRKPLVRGQERYGAWKIQKVAIKSENATLDTRTQSRKRILYCTCPPRAVDVGTPTFDQRMLACICSPPAAAAQPPLRSASLTSQGSPGTIIGI